MSDTKLGQIITADQGRDAIHIAIAPMESDTILYPGQHVGVDGENRNKVKPGADKLIGIVDPYLTHPVMPGQKFWLCLYPQTVTSLRHEWTHPAFAPAGRAPTEESKLWLADFAQKCGVSYDRMMYAIENDDYINMGDNEHYKNELDAHGAELKKHCEIVLGRTLTDTPYPFSCSC